MINIRYPASYENVERESRRLLGIFRAHQITDPSLGFGEATMTQGKMGQRLEFTHTVRREYPFICKAHINIGAEGKWQAGPGPGPSGRDTTGEGGTTFQRQNSFFEVSGGFINGVRVKIDGVDLLKKPIKKFIDAELFRNLNPIGVALYVGLNEGDLRSDKYDPKFELKFHSISGISERKMTAQHRAQFDLKWLWRGTGVRGSGVLRSGGPKFGTGRAWTGAGSPPEGDTCGRILLAIVTPPPFPMVVPVVTRNLSHGIYRTTYNTHKHAFF